ncbi:hypothetical protein AWW66_08840 [Micromonospora rosaria]|uniref:Uncharacterized protein n=1 Tax=Micromonospora rosaria TaxID=47874 RepID=A0A136PVY1_9ACTN|nr:hypothetical protein AWW66_08840 [Micromonospora rosaria]
MPSRPTGSIGSLGAASPGSTRTVNGWVLVLPGVGLVPPGVGLVLPGIGLALAVGAVGAGAAASAPLGGTSPPASAAATATIRKRRRPVTGRGAERVGVMGLSSGSLVR